MKRRLMLSLLLISAALFAAAEKLTVIGTTDIHGQLFSGKDKPNLLKLVRRENEFSGDRLRRSDSGERRDSA